MYKYSKLVKEEFFKDNVMAFYWLFYRAHYDSSLLFLDSAQDELGDDYARNEIRDTSIDAQSIPQILDEFDQLAWNTMIKGSELLLSFISSNGQDIQFQISTTQTPLAHTFTQSGELMSLSEGSTPMKYQPQTEHASDEKVRMLQGLHTVNIRGYVCE